MTIEEVFAQEWLWAAIAAMVAVAGAAGGVISWLIAVWIRHRDRPEPEWVVQVATNRGRAVGGAPERDAIQISGHIINAGDGTAYNVHLAGLDCTAELELKQPSGKQLVGVMHPGHSVPWSCSMSLAQWDKAHLVLSYLQPPTRHKKTQSKTIRVSDIANNPVPVHEQEAAKAGPFYATDISGGQL